jgi:ADP-ribose pyrophosphatase
MSGATLMPWEILETKEIFADEPWVKLSVQRVRLPDGRIVDNYYQIKTMDFAVIFARTPDGNIILERHYRHGVGKVCLTLPAGSLEKDEKPLTAAKRELLEETGYASDDWQSLGSFIGSANQGYSRSHMFIANKAQRIGKPHSGDLEETELVILPPKEVIYLAQQGEIAAVSNVAAIAMALNPSFTGKPNDKRGHTG